MAITTEQLAGELGFSDGSTNAPEPAHSKIRLRLDGSTEYVERYIDGRVPTGVTIPVAVIDLAIMLTATYQFNKPDAPGSSRFANSFLNSGAKSELKPWLSKGAG